MSERVSDVAVLSVEGDDQVAVIEEEVTPGEPLCAELAATAIRCAGCPLLRFRPKAAESEGVIQSEADMVDDGGDVIDSDDALPLFVQSIDRLDDGDTETPDEEEVVEAEPQRREPVAVGVTAPSEEAPYRSYLDLLFDDNEPIVMARRVEQKASDTVKVEVISDDQPEEKDEVEEYGPLEHPRVDTCPVETEVSADEPRADEPAVPQVELSLPLVVAHAKETMRAEVTVEREIIEESTPIIEPRDAPVRSEGLAEVTIEVLDEPQFTLPLTATPVELGELVVDMRAEDEVKVDVEVKVEMLPRELPNDHDTEGEPTALSNDMQAEYAAMSELPLPVAVTIHEPKQEAVLRLELEPESKPECDVPLEQIEPGEAVDSVVKWSPSRSIQPDQPEFVEHTVEAPVEVPAHLLGIGHEIEVDEDVNAWPDDTSADVPESYAQEPHVTPWPGVVASPDAHTVAPVAWSGVTTIPRQLAAVVLGLLRWGRAGIYTSF